MRIATFIMTAFLAAIAIEADAQEIRIGLVLPGGEDAAPLSQQMQAGAAAAAKATGAEMVTAREDCTAESGSAAAHEMLRREAHAVVGFLCTEAVEAALPLLSEAGIPVISPAVRTDGLTDLRQRTGWLFYRLGPRADAEQAAVARIIPSIWRDTLFAIVDDGTIYGRELAETLRAAAEEAGLEPVFFDTFRPQMENQIGLVGRLRRAGATHVFVGGDRADIAVMARDAQVLDQPLSIAGGEVLRAAPFDVPLAEGVLMVGLPEWRDIADPQTVETLEQDGVVAEGYVLPTHAAVEVAVAALRGNGDFAASLSAGGFDTVLGEIAFGPNGDLERDLYRLFRYDGGRFVEAD